VSAPGPVVAVRPARAGSSAAALLSRSPRSVTVLAAVALAGLLAAVELWWPGRSGSVAPALLAAACLLIAVLVGLRSVRRAGDAPRPWHALALIAGLLAVSQTISALHGSGVNPPGTGPQDLPILLAFPVAVVGCGQLVRSAARRTGWRELLDGTVALVALAGLVEVVLRNAPLGDVPLVSQALGLVYPAAGVVLCAAGLVTVGGVSDARRPAAGWLLACVGSLAVLAVSSSVAAVAPSTALDLVTGTAWVTMLAAGTLAVTADPGPGRHEEEPASHVPLLGVVLSYCAASGGVLLLLAGLLAGRPVHAVEAVAAALLVVLAFVRTLVWAADGARLTRRVLRAEAWFRTLVDTAADVTFVLDGGHRFTWASGAGRTPSAWTARELEGRRVTDYVHPGDAGQLQAVLDCADPEGVRGQTFRLRLRDGGWRHLEIVRVVPSGTLQGRPGVPVTGTGTDGLVLHLRDVDDSRTPQRELERMAWTDHLTGLPNRARLMTALSAARERAAVGEPTTVLLLDLDGFKAVNDIAGHAAGDLLLVEVADRLRATVRDQDLVSRLGGDEFAVVVRSDLAEAAALGERIIAELAGVHRSVPTAGADPDLVFDVSCSIGVAELHAADDASVSLRDADVALRAAKAAGKGCVRLHGEAADGATARRNRLVRDLPDALARGQLRLVYQPVVGVAERRVLGVEALLRWDHPVLGEVSPAEFVPLAEDDGLIVPLQRWVLEQATAELAGLLAQGRDLQLGVNISVRHLQSGSLVRDVTAALGRAGLPARRLMLEVAESVFIGELDRAGGELQTLHDMGCVISLDDFGRGYSTFAYLTRLPVDVLKMDREFLAGLTDDARSAALVHTVIELGRRLDIDVVAEGVETPGQLAALQELGCRFLQGQLLGPPARPEDLAAAVDAFDERLLDGLPVGLPVAVPVGE
jgi:diguanylate cyclase (GGDEF)-like protein/PAS domain S-box-containing protein